MKNKLPIIIGTITTALFGYLVLLTQACSNGWYLLTSNGFVLPVESSIMRFEVTQMNEGSGEWWIYGEDNNYYYHFLGEEGRVYIKAAKSITCPGLNPLDSQTWCK